MEGGRRVGGGWEEGGRWLVGRVGGGGEEGGEGREPVLCLALPWRFEEDQAFVFVTNLNTRT